MKSARRSNAIKHLFIAGDVYDFGIESEGDHEDDGVPGQDDGQDGGVRVGSDSKEAGSEDDESEAGQKEKWEAPKVGRGGKGKVAKRTTRNDWKKMRREMGLGSP